MKTFRPSHAYRWVKCNASVKLSETAKFDVTDLKNSSEEGIAAHLVAHSILKNNTFDALLVADISVPITEDMIDCGYEYKAIIDKWGTPLAIEQFLKIDEIHPKLTGTPDCYSIDFNNKLIRIIDYKYGFRPVEPFENWQMICYISGILSKIKSTGFSEKNWRVQFFIFQPRLNHIDGFCRIWETDTVNLLTYFNTLTTAAKSVFDENPIATTGTHCLNCQASPFCSTLQKASANVVNLSEKSHAFNLYLIQSSYELNIINEALYILKARQEGLEQQIIYELENGATSPYYELERTKTREKWKEGTDQQIIDIGLILGKNFAKPSAAISPAQCRKQFLNEEIIQQFATRGVGELKLEKKSTVKLHQLFKKDK